MNIGEIITRGLNRSNLSVKDYSFRELAWGYLMEIIQEHWESKHWGFRKRAFTITTASGTEEYTLDKQVKIQDIIPNTMRGSDPVRRLHYEPSHDFYKKRAFELGSGSPYYYRDGVYKHVNTQPSAASVITFVSSLTNYTTGTVAVVQGLTKIVITTGSFTIDMLGRYFRVGTEAKRYKIVKFESSSTVYLESPYEGSSNAAATFTIGDINQTISVLYKDANGYLKEEEVQLNGSSSVPTIGSVTTLIKISKYEKTIGYITATSNSGGVTNLVLDPAETEVEYQTVKLYPIPSATETINYEAYIKHPLLYRFTDSSLFPQEFHNLLVLDLYIRLQEEWNKVDVSQGVLDRREKLLTSMREIDNNTNQWETHQEAYESIDIPVTNLPNSYGTDDI